MNHRFAVLFIAVLFWQGAALAQSAPSQGGQSGNRVNLDFANADVVAVIQAIGEMTGKNLLVDPRVKGTLTLSTPRPVSRAVAYDLLLSALRLQGYAAVESGGVIRVVPEAEAKFYAVPITGKKRPAASGQMVSRVFQLRHESASQLVAVLRPLVSPNSVISADAMSNTLLVTDYAENVGRLAQIIDSMDVAGVGDPVIMPLRYASAQEVAGLINRVFGTAAPGQTADMSRVDVAVDSRTNSLIVRTESPARLSRVQVLVNSLDVPTPVAGNVHVIYLKNAEAAKVAQTLRNILSGDTASLAPTAPATTPAGTATAAGAAQARNTAGADTAGPGMVQADPATNALIITAPDAVFSNLKAVVEKLDVRRAQVLVEALIAEVTADKAAEFGIQWMNLSGLDDSGTSVIGGFGNSSASSNIGVVAANPAASARGFNLGIVDGTVTIPGIDEPIANLGLLARALETNANANILSTPSLLALDNEEAKISIGANVPFQTGQYQITGSSAAPFQTIERKDVGLTLRSARAAASGSKSTRRCPSSGRART